MNPEEQDGLLATTAQRLPAPSSLPALTSQEWVALLVLRRRYREGQDLWDARELAHLRFLRWLHNAGRVES